MALSRRMLKAMGIEDEKIDQIIEAHVETTDSLKADRDKYKEEAEKVSEVQRELDAVKRERDELQAKVDADDSYKAKYESEHAAYEEFKSGVAAEKEDAKKANAYKELLKKAGVSDKRHDAILKLNKYKDLTFNDKGDRSMTLKPEGTAGRVRLRRREGHEEGASVLRDFRKGQPVQSAAA